MERRRFLTTVVAGTGLPLTAGCLGGGDGTGGDGGDGAGDGAGTGDAATSPSTAADGGATGTDTGTVGGRTASEGDLGAIMNADLPVSDQDLTVGAAKDGIPAITNPAFGPDWSETEWSLDDRDRVIGVTTDDEARAYPLAILNWHEIANDTFGGPLLVTFCPLCGSGVVAERTVRGEETVFGVSGYLWHSDLVMYDRKTDSLWSQILARSIQGEMTGTTLTLRPSTLTTWGEWRAAHPETEVLLPPPASSTVKGRQATRSYDRDPYASYAESRTVGITGREAASGLHPKADVIGVTRGETAKAYPLNTIWEEGGLVNDSVEDRPVVVAASDGGTLVAYDRTVAGEVLTFELDGGDLVGGGSRWGLVTGRALDGPHEGTTLDQANDRSPMFWFAWADFHPDTDIYGQ
jgi:hypothetical protein